VALVAPLRSFVHLAHGFERPAPAQVLFSERYADVELRRI
jgi:hypothetical protein